MVAVKKVICARHELRDVVVKLMDGYQFILVDTRPRLLREGFALVKAWGKLKREAEGRR